ncbi:MAG: DUF4035 domain-containing protein [Methyloligellaceae bacterium]
MYYSINPFGEERADARAALIACTIANIHRDPKGRAYRLDDFMLNFGGPEKRKQTPEEMQRILKLASAAAQINKRLKERGKGDHRRT